MTENTSDVYVATSTAQVQYGEGRTVIKKGVTRVRAGHALLEKYPDLFKPADQDVRFEIEDAVSRPAAAAGGSRASAAAKKAEAKPEAKKVDTSKAAAKKATSTNGASGGAGN